MRIAVVNNFFPPRPGGSSHLADHLARAYAAAGNEVIVLTASYQDAPEVEERDGFTVLRIPGWIMPKNRFAMNFDIAFTMSRATLTRVNRVLDDFVPDVIHQHGQFFDLTWITGLWARRHRVPTLLSIHTRLYSPNALHNSVYAFLDHCVVKPLMWLHKPVLVVMDVLMDRYIDARYSGAFAAKVNIPVGIDLEHLRSGDAPRAREALGLRDEHVILSVGHVIPQRNRVALIEALPRILEAHPSTRVVVIGTVYHDAFLTRAKELGVSRAVLAPGSVPQSAIPDYLAAADIECHELDGQGFGTASLEALAVGTVVVAAIRPDNFIGICIEDGRHLYLAPFVSEADERADPAGLADVINRVLEDPRAAREAVADAARALAAEQFSIQAVADRHLAAMRDLVFR